MGQNKPVTIHRFLVQNTIEEKLVKIQHSKKELAANIFSLKESDGDKQEILKQLCNLLYK